MTQVFAHFSNIIIPVIIFYIVAYGITVRTNVYEEFIKGAKDGFHTVIQIMPTLIGLMVAVGVLRASGFLDFIGSLFAGITRQFGFSSELIPLILVKMFSSSAATGLVLEPRPGFPDRYDDFHYDELYGNGFLYNVRLLYGGKSDKNTLYADRRDSFNNNRSYSQHCAGGNDVVV